MSRLRMMSIVTLSVAALSALMARPVAGADAPVAKDLIARAVEAHGGHAALEAWPVLESKGTLESLGGRGAGRRSDMILRERPDGAYRREVTFDFRGRRVTSVEFYDGTVVKRRFGQTWDDMPTDEARESAAHRVDLLVRIDPAAAKVEGEATEADVACWTVSVPDGSERATLWLAQDDGRLVAMDYPATSADGMGVKKHVRRKAIFRDPRKVGVLVLPHDVEWSEDGTPDARMRLESIRVLQEFEAEWIKLPDPTRRYIPSEELAN